MDPRDALHHVRRARVYITEVYDQCDKLAVDSRNRYRAPERSALSLQMAEFLYNTVQDRSNDAAAPKKQLDPFRRLDGTPTWDRQTDRQTEGYSWYRASMESRGQNLQRDQSVRRCTCDKSAAN